MPTTLHSGYARIFLLAATLALAACGGGGGGGGGDDPDPKLFWLEPTTSTVIGVGQEIGVYAALKAAASDPYPAYVDAAAITWASSNPGCAAVDAEGNVTGLQQPCSTVISATYQAHADQLTVQVSGTWLNRNVFVAGQGTRQYSLYEPDFTGAAGPHPTLLSLHGGGGSAMIQASTSRLVELASTQKIYVVFLEGSGVIQTYNAGACCGYAQTNSIDDVAYVNAVLDDVESDNVDTAKIYSSGFSNGGMMSHRLACAVADRLAGIAAVGGASAEFDLDHNQYYVCNPARPIPVLHIHASNDRNYPYAGGVGDGLSATAYYPVELAIADWRARNNVTAQATVETVTPTTTCYHYATPANGAQPSARVTLCKVDPVDVYDPVNEIVFGGGHSWPGGTRSPTAKSDVPPTDFNANNYLWNFLNP